MKQEILCHFTENKTKAEKVYDIPPSYRAGNCRDNIYMQNQLNPESTSLTNALECIIYFIKKEYAEIKL